MMGRQNTELTEQQLQSIVESYKRKRSVSCAMELSGVLSAPAFDRARAMLVAQGKIGAEWLSHIERKRRGYQRKRVDSAPTRAADVDTTRWNEPPEYKHVFNLICHPQLRSTT